VARTVSYALVRFRTSLPAHPAPATGGRLQLTDAEWRVVFHPPRPGIRCGLLRSRIDVEPVTRHRCRVTVHDRDTDEFRGSFVVRARARRVRADVDRRMAVLDRAGDVIASVEDGQWWRDVRRFDGLGWARTASVAGVRCRGGRWGADTVAPTRWTKVLDVGPDGVTLRGWRTRAELPWETVDGIEVTGDRDCSRRRGAGRPGAHGRADGGTVVRLRSRTGDELDFHTVLSSTDDIAARLHPVEDQLTRR
jgi:hypothetical protein